VNGPLVLVVELVDLVPLHVAGVDRLSGGVPDHWHLEEEQVVGSWWRTSHFVAHAVEVVGVTEELSAEATEHQNVLAVLLNCSASLSFGEHLVAHLDERPLVLVLLVVALNGVYVLASGVGDATEHVDGSVAETARTVVVAADI